MLFANVASTVSIETIVNWWPIVFFAIFNPLFGMLIGFLFCKVFRRKKDVTKFVMVCFGFKNTNSLPLSVVIGLVASIPSLLMGPDDTVDSAHQRAAGYVMLYMVIVALLRWSVGFQLMKNKDRAGADEIIEVQQENEEAEFEETEMLVEETETRKSENEDPSEDVVTNSLGLQSMALIAQEEAENQKGNKCIHRTNKLNKSIRNSLKGPKTSKVFRILKEIFNPPLIAGIISIGVGLISPLQSLFFGSGAPLANSVTLAISSLGNCCIPMVLVALGSRLGKGPVHMTGKTVIKGWMYTCIIFFNLLLLPFMVSGIVIFMSKYNLIPQDPVMYLVIMFEAAAPTATNVMTMAIYTGSFEQDTVNLLFYSYILAALTFPICSVVFVALCTL